MGCHLPWVHATGQAGPWCLGSRPRGLPAAARVFRAHPCRRRFRGGRRRGSARPTPPVRFPPVGTLQAQPASALRRRPWAAIHTRGVHPCPPRPEPPSLHHQLAWAASLSWHWEALRRRQVKRWARADSLAMQGLHHSLASVQQHLAGLECCRLLLDLSGTQFSRPLHEQLQLCQHQPSPPYQPVPWPVFVLPPARWQVCALPLALSQAAHSPAAPFQSVPILPAPFFAEWPLLQPLPEAALLVPPQLLQPRHSFGLHEPP
mmetsp:Transcript_76842/g.207308  ORF Transcript_76842/g.207308 Transcript_76842/m.207308 type:complete len:261 (-) Transcript_76842:4084-4866(-)